MMQTGLLDWQIRFRQLDAGGDALPKFKKLVDWERFRVDLEAVRDKQCREKSLCRHPDVQGACAPIAVQPFG